MVEFWRKSPKFPGYLFSNFGRIKSLRKGQEKIIKGCVAKDGYIKFSAYGKNNPVHFIIAELFIGPRSDGKIIRHLDDNKYNNNVDNLVYGNSSENCQDRIKNKTWLKPQLTRAESV